jgi:hypothetical protein
MVNNTKPKMIITVDLDSEKIESVEVVTPQNENVNINLGNQSQQPLTPDGGYRYIGLLLAYNGSHCVTINLPGGGSYTYCY